MDLRILRHYLKSTEQKSKKMKKISVLLFIFITIGTVWAMLALFFSVSIEDLKVQKDKTAMHGAWIFSFRAGKNDISTIIKKNSLEGYARIPDELKYIIDRFKNTSWWKLSNELRLMKIYGLMEKEAYEWHVMFLFAGDERRVYGLKL